MIENQPHHLLNTSRIENIVVEKEFDEPSTCPLYAFVPIIDHAQVQFVDNYPRSLIFKGLHQLNGAVSRRIINHQNFYRLVRLRQSRSQALAYPSGSVKGGNTDGDERLTAPGNLILRRSR